MFVHGIGEQRQGETLVRFGEPLFTWIRGWIGQAEAGTSGQNSVQLARAFLLGRQTPYPSHAEVNVDLRGKKNRGFRLVIAESWWATVFLPAKFLDVALWGASFLPLVLVRIWLRSNHAVGRRIGQPLKRVRQKDIPILVLVSLPLITLGVALLIAEAALLIAVLLLGLLSIAGLLLLSLVPAIRPQVVKAQLGIANSAGDAYVLMHSPFSLEAMVGQLRTDLMWLESKADRIVVVGHSQGSVVAYEALLKYESTKLAAFVTVGSALNLLEHGQRAPRLERIRQFQQVHPGIAWINFWTAYDPVAAGELVEQTVDGLKEYQVDNRASVLGDHSTYPDNTEQFVARLACILATTAGFSLPKLTRGDPTKLKQANLHRRERVQILSNVRLTAIGAWLLGGVVLAGLAGPTPARLLAPITGLGHSIAGWVPLDAHISNALSQLVDAFLIAAVSIGIYYTALLGVWLWWDRAAMRKMTSRARGDYDAKFRLVFQLAGLPFGLANVFVLIRAGAPQAEYLARYRLMLLYTVLYAVLGAMLIFARTGPLDAVSLTSARAAAWGRRYRDAFLGQSEGDAPSA